MNQDELDNIDANVTAEASAWLAQFESGEMSAEDYSALREWMRQSPAHRREFASIVQLSNNLASLTDLANPIMHKALKRRRFLRFPKPFSLSGVAAACALVAVLVAAPIIYFNMYSHADVTPAYYRTDFGEYKTVTLDDGSLVKLNTNTAIEVSYTRSKRNLRLTMGEAFFDVAKDEARPFTVIAGVHSATAIGTAFSVRLDEDDVRLIVTEGSVEFAALPLAAAGQKAITAKRQDDKNPPARLIKAGQEAVSTPDTGRPSAPAPLDERLRLQKLSWTEGLLDFSDTPLSQVVDELQRHTGKEFVLGSPELENVRFGGVFRVSDTDAVLKALSNFGIEADVQYEDKIILLNAESN